ncbi:D-erythronate dehydrogenase [Frondihabitans australicus]|uniref:Nucleoside-diphosphate-sugar epimerase n=1 Tax=Frondihabitans australicus TaxID=386892 RepID=A0A495IEU1_9MICO|nr:D-erythronate dehydrogenase [Frondihabitans australicus]RKR73526.1 nucleoside-diphosphate-sugar epimerase [Frondihabitans australicus]
MSQSSLTVVITGGAGFLGSLLARTLLKAGSLGVGGAAPQAIGRLLLVDLVAPRPELAADERVEAVVGELDDVAQELPDADVVFHLAGVVSGAAEADFDLGLHTNLDGTRLVLERARAQATPPVLVFASSVAVFGADPALGPIGRVDDDTLPRPQSSYGIQKFIGEQLVADYARKGFVRGRSVRLMTVSVRPGKPNAAASSFLSGIIREPLAGERAVCPVDPDLPVALSSPRKTIEGIMLAATAADDAWGSLTAMTLPGLTTTPRAMAAALDAVTGEETSALIDWAPDPAIEAIVITWAADVATPRAESMGLAPEASFDDIVRQYVESLG